jgi:hypothetical protein
MKTFFCKHFGGKCFCLLVGSTPLLSLDSKDHPPCPLYTLGVTAEKTWANFEHFFGLLFGLQGLQIGFPNSMVSFFFLFLKPWGPIQGPKVQHLFISNLRHHIEKKKKK